MEAGFFSGQLLIAMPGISDPRFERALILICAHDEEHAMGLALNNPVEGLTVPDLLEKLEIRSTIVLPPDLVLVGGPVEQERGFVLHSTDYDGEASLDVTPSVALTATREDDPDLPSKRAQFHWGPKEGKNRFDPAGNPKRMRK